MGKHLDETDNRWEAKLRHLRFETGLDRLTARVVVRLYSLEAESSGFQEACRLLPRVVTHPSWEVRAVLARNIANNTEAHHLSGRICNAWVLEGSRDESTQEFAMLVRRAFWCLGDHPETEMLHNCRVSIPECRSLLKLVLTNGEQWGEWLRYLNSRPSHHARSLSTSISEVARRSGTKGNLSQNILRHADDLAGARNTTLSQSDILDEIPEEPSQHGKRVKVPKVPPPYVAILSTSRDTETLVKAWGELLKSLALASSLGRPIWTPDFQKLALELLLSPSARRP